MRNQSEKVSEIIKRIKDYLESECINTNAPLIDESEDNLYE